MNYTLDDTDAFSFLTFLDKLEFFADTKNLSNPPLKSTVLKAEFVTLSLIFFFRISLLKVTFFKLGKNLRLVLFLA